MGAVTSKEGYDLEGRKYCKENFHFLENYGLPTLPPPDPPPPPHPRKRRFIIFWPKCDFDFVSVWKIKLWFSKVSTQNLHHYNVQQKHTAVHFSADRINRAEGDWLGRVQSVFIVGRSRWPQQYKFRSRCKYSVCSSLKKVPVNMLSSRANRQVLRACRLAISPFLRRNIQTSKPRSTFAKDLFLGRFNKVRELKIYSSVFF